MHYQNLGSRLKFSRHTFHILLILSVTKNHFMCYVTRVLSVGKNHTIRFQSTPKVPFCTHASATFYHGFNDRLWLCFRVCLYFVRIKWLIRQWDIWNLSPKECRKIGIKFFSNFQSHGFFNWFKTDTKVGISVPILLIQSYSS